MDRVSFTCMSEGSARDFRLIDANDAETATALPDRLLAHLALLAEDDGAYRVDRLEHLLQTATRAENDGADDDWIVAALLHDLGDVLAPFSHAAVAAEILRPFVRDEVTWVVRHHAIFQRRHYANRPEGERRAHERLRDHPHYRAALDFCDRWDQCSFDPDYESRTLEHFEPALRRVFARTPQPDVI